MSEDNANLSVVGAAQSPLDVAIPENDRGPMLEAPNDFKTNERIDELERAMMQFPAVECPIANQFTPGLYGRHIFMPKGTILTSKIHRTEHQYVVLSGRCMVWIEGEGWTEIVAPHVGITKPGTRRVLVMLEDTRWMTFHPTDKTDVDEIEVDIIQKHKDHLKGLEQPMREAFGLLENRQ
jgi:quercetin dioxygenase-like cupin family protein